MAEQKRSRRAYEPSAHDLETFVFEESLQFEVIGTKLAEQYAPDGPDEEDCVYQMTKSLFQKRFSPSKRTRPQSYDEAEALDKFNQLVLAKPSESQVQHELDDLGGRSGSHLRRKVPRKNFNSMTLWLRALHEEIITLLMPEALGRRDDGQQTLNVSREELDDAFDRALRRLFQIKAAKSRITFRERLRFDRTHPDRLIGEVVE